MILYLVNANSGRIREFERTSARQGILEAHVERCIRETRKSHSCLADNIFRSAVVISNRVLNLQGVRVSDQCSCALMAAVFSSNIRAY